MNCQDITDLLDSRSNADFTVAQLLRLGEHVLACESCESAWRASRMLRLWGETRTPPPRADLLLETMRIAATEPPQAQQQPRLAWLSAALGAALAASIAVVVVLGIHFPRTSDPGDPAPGLTIALHETRDVTLAIDSVENLTDARIRVALSGGIELAGRLGQRELRWTADIDAGINRLTIPIVAVGSEDAELLVEVEHGSKHRRFLVQVDVVSDAEARLMTG